MARATVTAMSDDEEIATLRAEIEGLRQRIEVRRAGIAEMRRTRDTMSEADRTRLQRWRLAEWLLRRILAIELMIAGLAIVAWLIAFLH